MTGVLFGVLFFFGAVGLAAVGWGISISQDDSSSYPSWTDTALIAGGAAFTAAIALSLLILALVIVLRRRERILPPAQEPGLPPVMPTAPVVPVAPTTSSIAYWVGRPNTHGDRFFGRQPDLDNLDSALVDSRVVVVSGGAGVGKSQLVAEYSHREGRDGFWTAAGDSTTQTLVGLAQHLGVEEGTRTPDEIADDVRRHLTTLPPDTLWIVDNLVDIAQVNALAGATGAVPLLVTTRDGRGHLLSGASKFLGLKVIGEQDAIDLLCSRSRADPSDGHLKDIARAVGNLPLALEMLGRRMGEYRQTPAGILAQLNTAPTTIQWERFRETEGSSVDQPEGVFATITGTLATLPGDLRARLSPLGYIADAPVPHDLLKALVQLDDEEVTKLVEECRRRSIISIVEGRATVHALTVAAIAATNPEGSPETALARGRTRLNSINRDDPVALREEMNHYERLLFQTKKVLGAEDSATLNLANSLGVGYHSLGRFEEAIKLQEGMLRIIDQTLGSEHGNTLTTRSNLAGYYSAASRHAEAIDLNEGTLRARERILGPEHPDTLGSRNNLAISYHDLGRHHDAIELDEVTVEIRGRVLGPEDPDTLSSRSNLAICYQEVGRDDEAIELCEVTYRVRERVLGPEHPDTLASRHNLAGCYLEVGRNDEAIELHEGTLKIMEHILGPDHPNTLSSRHNLAICYRKVGRNREANELEAKGT